LKLAKRVADRAVLSEGDAIADAIAGCFACGTRRSSTFHRGRSFTTWNGHFTLWGSCPAPRPTLSPTAGPVRRRSPRLLSPAAVADAVAEGALKLTPAEVQAGLTNWRKLLGAA